MNNLVQFNNHEFELVEYNGQRWLTKGQIALALDYADESQISKLYYSHKDEFTDAMTCLIKKGKTRMRLFSLRGCRMLGFFARTRIAKEFRKWVLDLIEKFDCLNETSKTLVREHKRALPSGKKEIVLSEKAKQEIGGIAKAVVTKTLDEKLPQYFRPSDKLPDKVISAAFHQTADEMQEKKKGELKEYHLSRSEAEVIEIIRSANTFNMLNLFMGVSNKLSA